MKKGVRLRLVATPQSTPDAGLNFLAEADELGIHRGQFLVLQ